MDRSWSREEKREEMTQAGKRKRVDRLQRYGSKDEMWEGQTWGFLHLTARGVIRPTNWSGFVVRRLVHSHAYHTLPISSSLSQRHT